ncbi:MAG: helix-turn-helix domain-containing protein [Syntrophomonadaceae bacterium]|jgi:cytoskeleton protein RodZ
MSFGRTLQEARKNKGYSLEYVEEETKIRKLYITALEEENFKVLPPKVYATGFVRKYAKFIGLEPDKMVEEFQSLAYVDEPVIEKHETKENKHLSGFNLPYRNLLAGIIFLVIAIWAGNMVAGFISERITYPIQNKDPQEKAEEIVKVPDQKNDDVEVEKDKISLLITARQDCWLNIVVDGVSVYSQTMKPGESQTFNGEQSIYIKAGNAGGIDIILNGKEQEPLGGNWEVKEKEFTLESLQG